MPSDEDSVRRAICAEVARLLREARQRRGFSMTALAQQAGLSQQMVSYVERGLRNPTLDTLLRITGVLGVDLGEVLRRAERTVGEGKGGRT